MNIEKFPLCCGAYLLYGFQEHYRDVRRGFHKDSNPKVRQPTPAEAREFVQNSIELVNGRPIIAILTEFQRYTQHYGKVLEEAGFKVVHEWTNPGSLNRLAMYMHSGPMLDDED